jgi:hypothetical protein
MTDNIKNYPLYSRFEDTDRVKIYAQKNGFKPVALTLGDLKDEIVSSITIPSVTAKTVISVTQSGAMFPPIPQATLIDDLGLISITYDLAGTYTFQFASGSFPDTTKVIVSRTRSPKVGFQYFDVDWDVLDDATIQIFVRPLSYAAGIVKVAAPADDLLGSGGIPTILTFEVYP